MQECHIKRDSCRSHEENSNQDISEADLPQFPVSLNAKLPEFRICNGI